MRDPREYYLTRIDELTRESNALKSKSDRIAWMRLLAIVLVLISIYFGFAYSYYLFWISLLITIGFLRLVQTHLGYKSEIETQSIIARLCSDEIKYKAGDHSVFDPGPAGAYTGHIYVNDLDIFGRTSLFQAINRTVTFGGRRMMIDTLLDPPGHIESIARRRQAISDLDQRVSWRQRFFATGARSGEAFGDVTNLESWLEQPGFFSRGRHWLWIAVGAVVLTLAVTAWMIVEGRFYPGLFFGVIIINTAVLQFASKNIRHYFNAFGSRTTLYRKFSEMFHIIASEQFESPFCNDLRSKVVEASQAFLRLSRLHNLAEQRTNPLVASVMNGLFMFDIWTIRRIERWRSEHQGKVQVWIRSLNEMDMLASCANFKFNNPQYCEAETEVSSPFIRSEGLGHPLISDEIVVRNDYEVGTTTRAHIITGSNMAGKSTFIRAVGLNVVLALNGLPVSARSFSCSIMKIASCIRITDSLEDHASYFKAELDRLSTILDLLGSGASYIVLLDEILRGTNSEDKHEGTLAFYKRLGTFNCISLLATHDLSIGKLEQEFPQRFGNYCFESSVDGSDLKFDYKLRPGVSRSTNATFLMRKLNLID